MLNNQQALLRKAPIISGWAVSCFMATSGFLKLFSFTEFQNSLYTWKLLPSWTIDFAVVIPAIELSLALMFFLSVKRFFALASLGVLLLMFTILYSIHLIFSEKPSCACMGPISEYVRQTGTAIEYLTRNIVLLTLTVISLLNCKKSTLITRGANL